MESYPQYIKNEEALKELLSRPNMYITGHNNFNSAGILSLIRVMNKFSL